MQIEMEHEIQQTWGVARMTSRVTEEEHSKHRTEYQQRMSALLAKPTASIYTLPPGAAPAKAQRYKAFSEFSGVSFNCLSLRRSGRLREILEDGGTWGLHLMCFQGTQMFFKQQPARRRCRIIGGRGRWRGHRNGAGRSDNGECRGGRRPAAAGVATLHCERVVR